MLTGDEIRILLSDIENDRVERTTSTKDTDKYARAVCAFANDMSNKRTPGYLMIGAWDDGTLNGLKVTDELLRNYAGLRSDGNILPQPALMVYKVSLPEGDIAVVEVQPSKITPVKYKGTTYIRIGARRGIANEEEERILREKSEVKTATFDTTPCLQTSVDDLDLDLFKKEYLPKFVPETITKGDNRDIKQQLASLQLFDTKHDSPTVAGILLVGKDPKHILFGSYIQYVKYAGKTRTSKILNERQFSGNLLTMLKELDAFVKYTIQTQRPVFVTVLREEMKINYPYEAMRELAMNLVMHRNYQTNSPAKFYEYPDRIEMDNPGNLYGKVRPDNFPNESDYRNPVIAEAMKTLGYVNRFSRGVNMVQETLEANKNGLAIFSFDDITTFKVTVMNADAEAVNEAVNEAESGAENEPVNEPVKNQKSIDNQNNTKETNKNDTVNEPVNEPVNEAKKLTVRQITIVTLIDKDNTLSRESIANKLGIGRSTVFREINKLKKLGVIKRVGSDKNGYWLIKE